MRTKFLLIFSVFLVVASVCSAKDRPKHVRSTYAKSQPSRIKPVFEKPSFDSGNRVRSVRERAVFEKPVMAKKQIEKPQFDKDRKERPDWAESILESKWKQDPQQVHVAAPTEKESQSKVKRGWFRTLRAP